MKKFSTLRLQVSNFELYLCHVLKKVRLFENKFLRFYF